MDMKVLPLFWLAYLSDPSDSGRIHSNIRQRWLSGTYLRLREVDDGYIKSFLIIDWWFAHYVYTLAIEDSFSRKRSHSFDGLVSVPSQANLWLLTPWRLLPSSPTRPGWSERSWMFFKEPSMWNKKEKKRKCWKKGMSVHILWVASLTNGIKIFRRPWKCHQNK